MSAPSVGARLRQWQEGPPVALTAATVERFCLLVGAEHQAVPAMASFAAVAPLMKELLHRHFHRAATVILRRHTVELLRWGSPGVVVPRVRVFATRPSAAGAVVGVSGELYDGDPSDGPFARHTLAFLMRGIDVVAEPGDEPVSIVGGGDAGNRPPDVVVTRTIGQDAVVAYGDLVGDRQAIHHDDEAARQAGFDAPIVPGVLLAAVCEDVASRGRVCTQLAATFSRPAPVGAPLELAAWWPAAAGDAVVVRASLAGDGGTVTKAVVHADGAKELTL